MATSNFSLLGLSQSLAGAVAEAGQAVVAVHGRPRVPSSGVLWRTGVVVTSDHTLKRDEEITITLPDNRNVPAVLAGRDPGTDLAVLKLDSGEAAAANVDSAASLRAGDIVLAIGRRIENGLTASMGVVNAVGGAWRTWRGGHMEQFIRPDVNIYTGFSGGALADTEGRIIGINTSGLTRGAGTTVPAVTVNRVLEDILKRGKVSRAYLGVGLHPVQLPDEQQGVIVLSLEAGGPAASAGVFVGDVIVALNGQPVRDTDDVQSQLGPNRSGQPVTVSLVRGGQPVELKIVPGER